MRYLLLFVITAIFSFLTNGQGNFDFKNFKPLEAQGTMPDDFRDYTFQKVDGAKEDLEIEGVSRKQRAEFIKGIHYGIDQLLHSGKVLYGDPLTEYVNKVGNKITNNDRDLSNLRFFILRSNVVNALSTQQGIIFVTQGLIAQCENEAQVAFVLAHEIAHYIEDHVVQSYVNRIDIQGNRNAHEDKIKKLSQYSRDKEFEADEIGIKLYHQAGYSKKGLYGVFDVMTYSYLPFDLREIPGDYFNNHLLKVPDFLLTNEYPEISVEKDYDDSKSSHPNIISRTEKLEENIARYSRWGDIEGHFPHEEFLEARNIARFEGIRNDLSNFRYAEALYSIFLLEEEFPNNLYLERSKAQAWAGLVAGKAEGRFTDHVSKPSLIQGPPHKMYYFLRRMTKKQLFTVGLRMVTDIKNKYPTDKEVKAIYEYTVDILAGEKLFNLEDYQDITYEQAMREFELQSQTEEEGSYFEDEEEDEPASKYDKIRRQQGGASRNELDSASIKPSNFYLYALSDLVDNSEFISLYTQFESEHERIDEKERELQTMNPYDYQKEIKRLEKERLMLDLDNIILLEPQIQKLNLQRKFKPIKTEKLQVRLHEIVEEFEGPKDVEVHNISRAQYKDQGTIIYNERGALIGALMQMAEYPDSKIFPVDYPIYNEISERYGTSKVAFVMIESQFNLPIDITTVIYAILLPPYLLIDIPLKLTRMYEAQFNVIVFDLKTFKVEAFGQNNILGTTNKPTLHALLYDVINNLKQPKSISTETNTFD